MAVKYGPTKKQIGNAAGESIFAAARQERREKERQQVRQREADMLYRRELADTVRHIIRAGFIKLHYTDRRLSLYTTATQNNPTVIDMRPAGDHYYFAAIQQTS